jgi:hypothetical protein
VQGNGEHETGRDKGGSDQFEGESAHDVILHGYGYRVPGVAPGRVDQTMNSGWFVRPWVSANARISA